MDPNGNPVSLDLRMARSDPDGFKDKRPPTVKPDGRFTFLTAPSNNYRFYLPSGWGVKSSPKMGDASSGEEINLGDVVVERSRLNARFSQEAPRRRGTNYLGRVRFHAVQSAVSDWGGGGRSRVWMCIEEASWKDASS